MICKPERSVFNKQNKIRVNFSVLLFPFSQFPFFLSFNKKTPSHWHETHVYNVSACEIFPDIVWGLEEIIFVNTMKRNEALAASLICHLHDEKVGVCCTNQFQFTIGQNTLSLTVASEFCRYIQFNSFHLLSFSLYYSFFSTTRFYSGLQQLNFCYEKAQIQHTTTNTVIIFCLRSVRNCVWLKFIRTVRTHQTRKMKHFFHAQKSQN